MIQEILVALLGAIGVIVPAWFIYLNKKKELNLKIFQLKRELDEAKTIRTNNMMISIESINKIHLLATEMFKKTKADRFLILIAKNGKTEFRFCTVVYEQHKDHRDVYLSLGATNKFHGFEFDSTYLQMLKEAESTGYIRYQTDKMPDGILKQVYTNEKVTDSKIYFLNRRGLDDLNDEISYCSIATHNPEGFDQDDSITIRIFANVLKNELDKVK